MLRDRGAIEVGIRIDFVVLRAERECLLKVSGQRLGMSRQDILAFQYVLHPMPDTVIAARQSQMTACLDWRHRRDLPIDLLLKLQVPSRTRTHDQAGSEATYRFILDRATFRVRLRLVVAARCP